MSKGTFLLEIGLEEMPARFVTNSMDQLADNVEDWLKNHRLSFDNIKKYSTPRRLAIVIEGLDDKQADMEEEAKGPSKKIAIDSEGNWTKAAQGFSRGQGVSVEELYFKELKGEEYVFAKKFTEGQSTDVLLKGLKDVILSMQFPKNMKWGSHNLKYVRPIKWLVALFDSKVIPFGIADVHTNNTTLGHRFLGGFATLMKADDYINVLMGEHVIVDPVERKLAIRQQITELSAVEGWNIPIDEDLLEEVNNLVEYPTVLYGSFDERYLNIPEEVLITSMREHQRYFPVKDGDGKLLPYFVTVRNGDHRHLDNVRKGNEKVLRARLADAEFFYQEDLKKPLEEGLKRLESIVYHVELGSIGDKVRRIKELALTLGKDLDMTGERLAKVERAALLSKADLVTHMVGEFPELEGRMGEEYALKSGEDEEVAKGIYEHYLPKQAGDEPPATDIGAIVSVSDKLDTVVTSFGIGLIPTGSQDPHGLRRQTAGIVQIFLTHGWDLDLIQVLTEGIDVAEKRGLLKRDKESVKEDLVEFLKLRVKNLLQEQGVRYDVVDAVLKTDLGQIKTLVNKAHFLQDQLVNPEFKQVVEAFSRVTNISKKATDVRVDFDSNLLEGEAEKELYNSVQEVQAKVRDYLKTGKISFAYEELKGLVPKIHDYFDNTMVMAEDTTLRNNRLKQMQETSKIITTFADFQSIVFHSEE
ncbi:glycyl-tRNA synthetase beta chain [Evansella vedderi]|uniref:Glycine--tRNA ligase beta subunit n=1 Tax=Evansella vedderi TaxID=38282 RepID=A0ABT9ZUI8_9BACI|nr:glycine--tRNA ligase subunit beta [Evansella vedderi]MDQ0254366.1 glycyl-tRNA synthetase beta chain [Evansella vedderi]